MSSPSSSSGYPLRGSSYQHSQPADASCPSSQTRPGPLRNPHAQSTSQSTSPYINTFMTPPVPPGLQSPHHTSYPSYPQPYNSSYTTQAPTSFHPPHRTSSHVASPTLTPLYTALPNPYQTPIQSPQLHHPNQFESYSSTPSQSKAHDSSSSYAQPLVNPYEQLNSASSYAPTQSFSQHQPMSPISHPNQRRTSQGPAFFGPGDPLFSGARSSFSSSPQNSLHVQPQSDPSNSPSVGLAPSMQARSRTPSYNNRPSQFLSVDAPAPATATSSLPSASPHASSSSSSGSAPSGLSRTPSHNNPPLPVRRAPSHEFDDCPGCRAELDDAIQASLQSAQQEEERRARIQTERDELDQIFAANAIENDANKRREREEQELLLRAIENSKRDAELEAQRMAQEEALILEESRQHALRQQEERAKAELEMLEKAKLESQAEEEKRRQQIKGVQDAEKRALEESLQEQEREWLRRESAERSLLAFFQHRDAGPSSFSSTGDSSLSNQALPSQSEPASVQIRASERLGAPPQPQRLHSQDLEAEYWKFAGHDEAYRLALQMKAVGLESHPNGNTECGASASGPSRSGRPLPTPPGSVSSNAAAPAIPPKAPVDTSQAWHHFMSTDQQELYHSEAPPPAYEEAAKPPTNSTAAPSTNSTSVPSNETNRPATQPGTGEQSNPETSAPTPLAQRPLPVVVRDVGASNAQKPLTPISEHSVEGRLATPTAPLSSFDHLNHVNGSAHPLPSPGFLSVGGVSSTTTGSPPAPENRTSSLMQASSGTTHASPIIGPSGPMTQSPNRASTSTPTTPVVPSSTEIGPNSYMDQTPSPPDSELPSTPLGEPSQLHVPERASSSHMRHNSNRSSASSFTASTEAKGQSALAGVDFGYANLPFATKLDKSQMQPSNNTTSSSSAESSVSGANAAPSRPFFPSVIQLISSSNVAKRGSVEGAADSTSPSSPSDADSSGGPFFVIRAHSWKSLLRALAWYGNSRLEAGPEEVADASAAASSIYAATGKRVPEHCSLRAEVEFVTPTRVNMGYGVGDYSRYAQNMGVMAKTQSPAHVSLCLSLFPAPSSSQSSSAEAWLRSDEYLAIKRESKRLDAWYAGRGSTRRIIQVPRQPLSLPTAMVQVAQYLHAAHTFSAACPSSGSTARHSPRDLHHAVEKHDEGYIKKQKAMLASGAANAAHNNLLNQAGGSALSLSLTASRPGADGGINVPESSGANTGRHDPNDAGDNSTGPDLDFTDFEVFEDSLMMEPNGSFDAQDTILMGKRARLKAKMKRRLAKRNPDGRVVDEDLATWITPFDVSQQHG